MTDGKATPDEAVSLVDKAREQAATMLEKIFAAAQPGAVYGQPVSSESYTVITAAEVGAANAGDAAMAKALLADLPVPAEGDTPPAAGAALSGLTPAVITDQAPVLYGDAAYGTGALLADLEQRGVTAMTKVAAPTAPAGHFTKQQFRIDLEAGRVTCPARLQVPIIPARGGGGVARFGRACAVCPLASACTSSRAGRTITIHPQETRLQAARARQREPAWRADYRAHRPTVERKLAHLVRRRHGGRRARVRGFVAPGGTLLVIAAVKKAATDRPDGPWPLTRVEMESFAADGLELLRLEDFRDADAHRWRAELRRAGSA